MFGFLIIIILLLSHISLQQECLYKAIVFHYTRELNDEESEIVKLRNLEKELLEKKETINNQLKIIKTDLENKEQEVLIPTEA